MPLKVGDWVKCKQRNSCFYQTLGVVINYSRNHRYSVRWLSATEYQTLPEYFEAAIWVASKLALVKPEQAAMMLLGDI